MRPIGFDLRLMTFALCFALSTAAANFSQSLKDSQEKAGRRARIVASGRLIGTRDIQQVAVWNSAGTTQLAIKTVGSRPTVLWQTACTNGEDRVDSVRISDLDGDGLPEIMSLWWKEGRPGAALRVFHWESQAKAFAEVSVADANETRHVSNVSRYSLAPVQGRKRLLVFAPVSSPRAGRAIPNRQFDLRGNRLVQQSGGVIRVDFQSGIEGQAVISPVRPGPQRQGESSSAPYKTTLVVWSADGNREVTRFETGSDGRFRIALAPGTYKVGPPRSTGRFLPSAGEETVTVEPGKYVRVTISFDSGIR